MADERKIPRTFARVWLALVALLIAYLLSFGPACWISRFLQPSGTMVSLIYRPVIHVWQAAPDTLHGVITRYMLLGGSADDVVYSWNDDRIAFEVAK